MNSAELYKMVCEPDETDLDIQIPAVMLPQDAGATLQKMLSNGSSGRNLSVMLHCNSNQNDYISLISNTCEFFWFS